MLGRQPAFLELHRTDITQGGVQSRGAVERQPIHHLRLCRLARCKLSAIRMGSFERALQTLSWPNRPANHLTAEQIEHHCQVQPTFIGCQVSNVGFQTAPGVDGAKSRSIRLSATARSCFELVMALNLRLVLALIPCCAMSLRSVSKSVEGIPSSPTLFASGASEGGVSEDVSEVGSGLAPSFATSTGFGRSLLKKCRPQGDGTCQLHLVLASGGYGRCCRDSAYNSAKTMAIKITAYRNEVRMATLVDRAPSWAKAVATDAAVRNGMNIGILSV